MVANTRATFVADATLGKLAKYLRLAGFDTIFDNQKPDVCRLTQLVGRHRVLLTRSVSVFKCAKLPKIIFIRHNQPFQQLRQVLSVLDLSPSDLHPLTRCAICNQNIETATKAQVQGAVPEYVWLHQSDLFKCRQCQRIYWPGSHADRWLHFVNKAFK